MNCEHKVIITGTGRAGTTFLVHLLTELGLDTGYAPGAVREQIDPRCQAGLENDLWARRRKRTIGDWLRQPKHTIRDLVNGPLPAPYIVKDPALCETLGQLVACGGLTVDHVYIPIRDLAAAAMSRARVGGAHGSMPGGLWKTDNPLHQKAVLAEMFFNLVHTLATHDLPHTFLLFPRLVEDADYTRQKLWFLVKDIDPASFRTAFEKVADRRLVHDFGAGAARTAPRTIQGKSSGPAWTLPAAPGLLRPGAV
ncbi:MAG TPA: hypothetical protein VLW52_05480 [Opitutaceae bacterium]|nr:hypothetical protein [Opitutaceae bacterium]